MLTRLQQEYGDQLQVDWRAFELRPEPSPMLDPNAPYLQGAWQQSVYPMARSRGLVMRLPPVQPRSRRALEAAEFARDRDAFDAMHVGLFRAFFEHGRDLNDIDVLTDVVRQAGLNPEELRQALERGDHTGKVVGDEQLAHEIGVNAVPAMLIERIDPATGEVDETDDVWEAVMGAQPYPVVQAAVERVRRGVRPDQGGDSPGPQMITLDL